MCLNQTQVWHQVKKMIVPKFHYISSSRCHFYGGVDKFVWLYLPILILLLINSGMFIYVVTNICKNE